MTDCLVCDPRRKFTVEYDAPAGAARRAELRRLRLNYEGMREDLLRLHDSHILEGGLPTATHCELGSPQDPHGPSVTAVFVHSELKNGRVRTFFFVSSMLGGRATVVAKLAAGVEREERLAAAAAAAK